MEKTLFKEIKEGDEGDGMGDGTGDETEYGYGDEEEKIKENDVLRLSEKLKDFQNLSIHETKQLADEKKEENEDKSLSLSGNKINVGDLQEKMFEYFENSRLTELNPLSHAIETASITFSLKKSLLMSPILNYVNELQNKEKGGTTLSNEIKQFRNEIDETHRNQLLELEEYYRVIITPSNKEEEISEFRQEYNAAVDQISSQMKASDERRLEAALRTMNCLENDDRKGGYARLLSLIETGVKSSEDAVELLKSRLSSSREEFISLRHSDALLERTAQISYEKVRDAYSHLLRLSHKRANENDLQWIELESKGREWMMNEMKSILNGYRSQHSSTDYDMVVPNDHVNQHRLAASRRLQRFGDRVISTSLKKTERNEKYNDISLRSKKLQTFAWRKRQMEMLNDWLATTEREIDDCYSSSIHLLTEKISEIRSQIQYLDLHAKKLAHLRRVPAKTYHSIRSQSLDRRRASLRSSSVANGKTKETKRDPGDEIAIPPSVSMNIGTRLWGLSRSVGVDSEECVVLLTQLLHTMSPSDQLVFQRLSQFVTHYDTLLSKRK